MNEYLLAKINPTIFFFLDGSIYNFQKLVCTETHLVLHLQTISEIDDNTAF